MYMFMCIYIYIYIYTRACTLVGDTSTDRRTFNKHIHMFLIVFCTEGRRPRRRELHSIFWLALFASPMSLLPSRIMWAELSCCSGKPPLWFEGATGRFRTLFDFAGMWAELSCCSGKPPLWFEGATGRFSTLFDFARERES
jgi:hypothetical protein